MRWRASTSPEERTPGRCSPTPGDSAGRLIDAAGCRHEAGTAGSPPKHANFIQADAGGSADDVFALMVAVAREVRRVHGVDLHPETRGRAPPFCRRGRGGPGDRHAEPAAPSEPKVVRSGRLGAATPPRVVDAEPGEDPAIQDRRRSVQADRRRRRRAVLRRPAVVVLSSRQQRSAGRRGSTSTASSSTGPTEPTATSCDRRRASTGRRDGRRRPGLRARRSIMALPSVASARVERGGPARSRRVPPSPRWRCSPAGPRRAP